MRLRAAPPAMNGSRDFAAYHRLTERRTRGVKALFYGEGSQVAKEYKGRIRADATRGLEHFPLLAAFLWALAAIDLDALAWATTDGDQAYSSDDPADKTAGY